MIQALILALAAGAPPGDEPLPGVWRAALECPGGEIPFELDLRREGRQWSATIGNDPERIAVGRAAWEDGELLLELEPYDSRIRARVEADGARLVGEWDRYAGPDRRTRLAFRAEHGSAPRFSARPPEAAAAAQLAARWAVRFEQDEHLAVGLFECEADGRARGTFLTTLGDYRFLAGAFDGERLRLSCFDGAHAFLFDARLGDDGALEGDFWSRDAWHETWTASPDPDAALPDPFGLTRWTGEVPLNELAFPDPDGVRRRLDDPAFAGRARILTLFGTWCPNCNDEARLLAELDGRYRERGLAILGLAFEFGGELERDARQVERFRARHGLRYPILIAGVADKAKASAAFPAIDRLRAYPTAIFLDHTGAVRAVHTGFSGPATGPAHARLRERYEALIEELLAEAEGR